MAKPHGEDGQGGWLSSDDAVAMVDALSDFGPIEYPVPLRLLVTPPDAVTRWN